MKSKFAIAILSAVFCVSVLAAPAPWHKWRSKLDGKEFCAQISPGDGWEKVSGPYKDARCAKPGVPGGEPSVDKSSSAQEIYAECKSNCRDTFDSELGGCNMQDWDPLGQEYKSCVRYADKNYSACLARCQAILR